jgi:DNA-binding transcriptional regulator YhcF (GntR family)
LLPTPAAAAAAASSAEPIYRQIVEQVRRHVASGQWKAGDELPSVRALAQEHAINPMTVSKAYSLLEAEGLLERRRGMGRGHAPHLSPSVGRKRIPDTVEQELEQAVSVRLPIGKEQASGGASRHGAMGR